MSVRIGTSGYSFPEWKGYFYPEKIAAKDMLRYYAERLPTVEVNNTFYRLPKESVLADWAGEVPDDFQFVIKASQRITHFQRLKECDDLLGYLYRVTIVLGAKLGPLLFQLPPNFKKDVPRLQAFFAALPDRRRIAVEFRHESWFDDETFTALRDQAAALCVSDTGEEPATPLVATTDWGYLRLRREEFGDLELQDWARRIREQPWKDTYVFMKHEEEGRGPKLAARLAEIVGADARPQP